MLVHRIRKAVARAESTLPSRFQTGLLAMSEPLNLSIQAPNQTQGTPLHSASAMLAVCWPWFYSGCAPDLDDGQVLASLEAPKQSTASRASRPAYHARRPFLDK